MIKVNSIIKIDQQVIRRLTRAQAVALEQTANALHVEVSEHAQVMPFRTGNLQGESTFEKKTDSDKGIVTIITDTPYARRLYFHPEYHFDKTTNPNAGGEWYKDWLPGGKKAGYCQKAYKRIYRRLTRV